MSADYVSIECERTPHSQCPMTSKECACAHHVYAEELAARSDGGEADEREALRAAVKDWAYRHGFVTDASPIADEDAASESEGAIIDDLAAALARLRVVGRDANWTDDAFKFFDEHRGPRPVDETGRVSGDALYDFDGKQWDRDRSIFAGGWIASNAAALRASGARGQEPEKSRRAHNDAVTRDACSEGGI